MKFTILLLILMNSLTSLAGVSPYISSDGSLAKILIQGRDNDAIKLYDLMLVDHIEHANGVRTKEIISSSGQFQLTCNMATLIRIASCTAIISKGISSTSMNRENNIAHLEIWGIEGNELFKSFNTYTAHVHFVQFVTGEEELVISAKKDRFAFDYSLSTN